MNRAKIFIAFTFLLAFAVCVSAQINQFPNELEGFKFFGEGKLKDLKLGVSTREDIKLIFGEDCDDACDFDSNWKVSFKYFEFESIERDGIKFFPKQEFYGKLYSIMLTPKNKIPFQKVRFPKSFDCFHGGGSGYSNKGYTSREEKIFQDTNGLIYTICEKSIPIACKKGDLATIIYSIPEKSETEMFSLIKK